jgi:hypothetical protein
MSTVASAVGGAELAGLGVPAAGWGRLVRAGDRACLVGVRRYSAPVLDGLDDVRWAERSHAYGSAADIPDLLRQAASEGDATGETISAQYGSLFHQALSIRRLRRPCRSWPSWPGGGRRAEASSAGCSA